MLKEQQRDFIDSNLQSFKKQFIENLASESHETRRLPDPYIYVFDESKNEFINTAGNSIMGNIDADSYLGGAEYEAWERIEHWAKENDSGLSIWFSPPYKKQEYKTSKFIIHELFQLENGLKVLLNRAVGLDIDADSLLDLANSVSADVEIADSEVLRSQPLFPTQQEFRRWFEDELSGLTTQTEQIESGRDLLLKQETYASVQDIYSSIPIAGEDRFSFRIYEAALQKADERGLIGEHPKSCPTPHSERKTAFETVFNDSMVDYKSENNEVTCPFCKQKVRPIIKEGKIYCTNPSCGKGKNGVAYKCK